MEDKKIVQQEAADTFVSSDTPSPPRIHILFVDDCRFDRKFAEGFLKKANFQVTSVESGEEALEFLGLSNDKDDSTLNEKKIDIILTDYCMKEMNGHDLLRAVKENSNLKSIPVVIISSEPTPERISSCLENGAEEFLNKPLNFENVEKLRSYVKRESPVQKTGTKRKVKMDLVPESSSTERRPRIAGVAVA